MHKYLLAFVLFLFLFLFLFAVSSKNASALTPADLTCDDVTATFSPTSYTNEDIKVTVNFKDPSIAPSGTYRVLISTGTSAFPWGGYQDQEIDFIDKKRSVEFIIPGSNFNNAYKYYVYLENPGITYNATMCNFPGSITVFNKNFADLADKCEINMSNNYKEGAPMEGSIFIPDDSKLQFYFEIYQGDIKSSIPTTPIEGSPGITDNPVVIISTPNTPEFNIVSQKTLVPGKYNALQGDVIKKLGIAQYTAVIHAVANRSLLDIDEYSGTHFYCAVKPFKVSRDDTTEVTPGVSQPAPGAVVGNTVIKAGSEKTCRKDDKDCTTSEPILCSSGGIMTAIGCIPTEPKALVEGLLKYGTLAAGGIAFLVMIFAALQMITAEGNPESIKAAQEKFYSAIIGLLLIIFSVLLMQVIGVDILGLPGFNNPLPRGETT